MEQHYTRLEDYLDGTLSETESEALETELETNQSLAKELNLLRETREVLGDHFAYAKEDAALETTLQELQTDFFLQDDQAKATATIQDKKSAKRIPMYTRIAAIAAVLVGLVFVAYLFTRPQARVFADYAQHTAADFSEMGGGERLMSDAATAFNQANYQESTNLLGQALAIYPNRPDLQLYYGISLLETKAFGPAEDTFTSLLPNPAYKNEANWYLALTQWVQGRTKEAKEYLGKIEEGSSRYARAQELLRRLK